LDLEGPLEGLLDGQWNGANGTVDAVLVPVLLAELIEPANLLYRLRRLDLPPTTLTHLLKLRYHALLFQSPELLSLLPMQYHPQQSQRNNKFSFHIKKKNKMRKKI